MQLLNGLKIIQMGLKTLVKVGEISNLSDARYCAGMGVEMLGFNLNPEDPKFISPQSFKELTGWIAGVKYVGEFHHMSALEIQLAAADYELDYIQIENLDILTDVAGIGTPTIFKLNIDQLEILYNLSNLLELIGEHTQQVIITSTNTSLYDLIEKDISEINSELQIIRGFNVTVNNLNDLIGSGVYAGLALAGGDESRPGYNEYGNLMDILEALDED
ncbi:MAG: phosphoribosylanthranilate isomerase [Cyclobacteriaceae bacterium]